MIQATLNDGTTRMLDEAEVTLTWTAQEDDEASTSYSLDEVKALVVYDPILKTMPGMWRGMPIMGMAFVDTSDLRIEVPLPLGFANDLGQQLVKETDKFAASVKAAGSAKGGLQRYQALPADLPPPPGEKG